LNLDHAESLSRCVVRGLRKHRLRVGLSQMALATKAGVSRTAITMMENEQRNPTVIFCQALAKAMGIKLSDVVRRAEKIHPQQNDLTSE
jgi:DNA-binding XRE family transcriptional regulator